MMPKQTTGLTSVTAHNQLMRSAVTSQKQTAMEITQKPLHSSQRKHKKNEEAFSYNEKFKSKWTHEDTLNPRLFTYDGLWSLKSGRNQALY